jgi:hypothetical protein
VLWNGLDARERAIQNRARGEAIERPLLSTTRKEIRKPPGE